MIATPWDGTAGDLSLEQAQCHLQSSGRGQPLRWAPGPRPSPRHSLSLGEVFSVRPESTWEWASKAENAALRADLRPEEQRPFW